MLLPPMDRPDEIREFKAFAADRGVFVEYAAGSSILKAVAEGSIRRIFDYAAELGVDTIYSQLADCGARLAQQWGAETTRRKLDDLAATLDALGPAAEAAGFRIALENHIDYRAGEVAGLCSRCASPAIGFAFDTANQLALLDDPVEYFEIVQDRIHGSHIKDAYAVSAPDGADLLWCAPGEGLVDFQALKPGLLKAASRGAHLNLELIATQPWRVPYKTEAFWQCIWNGPPRRDNAILSRIERRIAENRPRYPDGAMELANAETRALKDALSALKSLFAA
ncbi:MAG: Xylose isomerase-like TIM barrel [candidate division BRC1 bacterium ADurb.BinA364]|nr:MAG: Xylose isomerase-like TIM barrel [candidate division BRC1 bacterium ADurb.BinA364]